MIGISTAGRRLAAPLPPAFGQPGRTCRAVATVLQEAYLHGTRTPDLEALAHVLRLDRASSSEIRGACAMLDAEIDAFRTRPIKGQYPYLWLDVTRQKGTTIGVPVSYLTVVAVGVGVRGDRRVLGIDAGQQSPGYWGAFLQSLADRGLTGVRVVLSARREGLRDAVSAVLPGARWQQGRLLLTPARQRAGARDVRRTVSGAVRTLTRLHDDIARRSRAIGIFPGRRALLRLVGALVADKDDQWAAEARH